MTSCRPILPGIRVAKAPEIQQIVLTGLNTTNFNEPLMRVERCQTCHMGIDRAGFEGAGAALRHAPASRCLVGASSRRKIRLYRLPCGTRVWPSPCLQRTANCIFSTRPHAWPSPCSPTPGFNPNVGNAISRSYQRLQFASTVAHGQKLFQTMGCPGCHLAQGYEQQAKVAPDLRRVASKVDPSWLVEWIKAPKEYWPATKMPNFLFSWEEVGGGCSVSAQLFSTLCRASISGQWRCRSREESSSRRSAVWDAIRSTAPVTPSRPI